MAQPIKMRYSKNFEALRSRIRRLPKLVDQAFESQIKKDVMNIITEYKNGIKRNNFNLEPLKPRTIAQKQKEGKPKPKIPLYGMGERKKNSLINALGLRKLSKGWKIYKRWAKHYEADLSLRDLLNIHEYGAIIKNGFGKGILIRIPPRPVYEKAIIRALQKKKAGEPNRSIKKAINQLINTGKDNLFKTLIRFQSREEVEIET